MRKLKMNVMKEAAAGTLVCDACGRRDILIACWVDMYCTHPDIVGPVGSEEMPGCGRLTWCCDCSGLRSVRMDLAK